MTIVSSTLRNFRLFQIIHLQSVAVGDRSDHLMTSSGLVASGGCAPVSGSSVAASLVKLRQDLAQTRESVRRMDAHIGGLSRDVVALVADVRAVMQCLNGVLRMNGGCSIEAAEAASSSAEKLPWSSASNAADECLTVSATSTVLSSNGGGSSSTGSNGARRMSAQHYQPLHLRQNQQQAQHQQHLRRPLSSLNDLLRADVAQTGDAAAALTVAHEHLTRSGSVRTARFGVAPENDDDRPVVTTFPAFGSGHAHPDVTSDDKPLAATRARNSGSGTQERRGFNSASGGTSNSEALGSDSSPQAAGSSSSRSAQRTCHYDASIPQLHTPHHQQPQQQHVCAVGIGQQSSSRQTPRYPQQQHETLTPKTSLSGTTTSASAMPSIPPADDVNPRDGGGTVLLTTDL